MIKRTGCRCYNRLMSTNNKRTITKTEYPHIVKDSGICSGEPVIEKSRVTVRSIISYLRYGRTLEDILMNYDYMNPSKIYAAVAYYHDHIDEIEYHIEQNSKDPSEIIGSEYVGKSKALSG